MNLNKSEQLQIEAYVRDFLSEQVILQDLDLFFFGSRVDGTSTAASDIDLGLWMKTKDPLPKGVLSELNEHLKEMPLFYVCQAVDFAQVSDDFRKTALKNTQAFLS